MKKQKLNSQESALLAAMKVTKAHCESIAGNPQNHPDIERKAATMVAGQLRHWIFHASHAPDMAPGMAVSSEMAKHRLDGLKVNTTRKIEELIESRAQMQQQLASQTQLINDIAGHIKQLNLPAELKGRIFAGAGAKSVVETAPKADSFLRTPPRSKAEVLHTLASC